MKIHPAGVVILAAIGFVLFVLLCAGGCAYRGGKVVDGTNLAIGITVPGVDWSINLIDYIGGIRVAGNDATRISVVHEVDETSAYFGVLDIHRVSRLSAEISPVVDAAESGAVQSKETEGAE